MTQAKAIQTKAIHEEIIEEIGTQTLAKFGLNIFSLNTFGAYNVSVVATNNITATYEHRKNNKQFFGFTHEAIEVGKNNIDSALHNTGEKSYTTDELSYINKVSKGEFKEGKYNSLKSQLVNQNYTKDEIEKLASKYPGFSKENDGLADVIVSDKNGKIIKQEQHKVIRKTKGKDGLYGKNDKYIQSDDLKIVVAKGDFEKHKNTLEETIKNSNNTKDIEAAKKTLSKLEQSQTSRDEAKSPRITAFKMQGKQAIGHIAQAGLSDAVIVALSTLANGATWEIKDAYNCTDDISITTRIKRLLKKVIEEFQKTFKRGASFGALDVGVGILSQIFKSISSKLKMIWKTLRTSMKSIFNAIYSFMNGEIKNYKELMSTIIKGLLSAILVVGTVALETELEVFLSPIVTPIVASFLAPALSIIIGSIAVVVMMKSVDLALNTLFGVFAQRDIAKMKSEEIKKIYEELMPDLIAETDELKFLITNTYKERKLSFEKSFDEFKNGLEAEDVNNIICGLVGINKMYGKKLQFNTQKDFNVFMKSNCNLKL
ncbi:MAG: hypothetical protein DRG78_12965 [Epsilonproteobacteria bacterium]|nr:MAG: hypothetical protein DRG78_12965 [Campylobacterota bacterium]